MVDIAAPNTKVYLLLINYYQYLNCILKFTVCSIYSLVLTYWL